MNAKIETIITRNVGGCNGGSVSNQVRSVASEDNFPVSSSRFFDYEITDLQKDSLQVILTDIIEDTTKISSIVVFAFQQIETCEYPIPVRFMYEIGSVSIVSSQFSIVNCEEVDLSELSFHNFQVPTGKKATLTIAITLR
jgi:hypothetical protein